MADNVAIVSKNKVGTYDDYTKLKEGAKYQLIKREIIIGPSPSFRHQVISQNLNRIIYKFVIGNDFEYVLYTPMDVYLDEKNVVQPDILFVHSKRENIIKDALAAEVFNLCKYDR